MRTAGAARDRLRRADDDGRWKIDDTALNCGCELAAERGVVRVDERATRIARPAVAKDHQPWRPPIQ